MEMEEEGNEEEREKEGERRRGGEMNGQERLKRRKVFGYNDIDMTITIDGRPIASTEYTCTNLSWESASVTNRGAFFFTHLPMISN